MCALPENPDALDIIRRSILMHPSLFADMLNDRQRQDRAYLATRDEVAIRRSVQASIDATGRAMDLVANEDSDGFAVDMAAGIIALNIACKLQCLPPHMRTAAAVKTWEG